MILEGVIIVSIIVIGSVLLGLYIGWISPPFTSLREGESPPSFTTNALKILLQLPFKESASPSLRIPSLQVKASSVSLSQKTFLNYLEVCTYKNAGLNNEYEADLSSVAQACFLEVLCLPFQLGLITNPKFPLRGLGLIHLKNVITQYRPVDFTKKISFLASVDGQRWSDVGIEVDIVLIAFDGDQSKPLWRCIATLISRASSSSSKAKNIPPAGEEKSEAEILQTTWNLSESTGRKYAKVSGDYNPHHLYSITAWPFGFSGPIAHGMYTLARSIAEVVRMGAWKVEYPYKISAEFKRPLVLPAKNITVKAEKIPANHERTEFVGLLPPKEEYKNGKAVSFGVFSAKGVPHMRASFATLE